MKLKLIEKITNLLPKKKSIGNSVLVSLSKVFSSVFNLLFMIKAVNLLTRSENGYLQYYLGFLPLILALAEFGLPSAIVKFLTPLTETKEEIGGILFSSLIMKFISFVLILIGAAIISIVYQQDLVVMFLLVIGATTTSFLTFFESIFVSFREYKLLAFWNFLGNLIKLLILYGADYYYPRVLGYEDILMIFCISPIFILFLFFVIFDDRKISWTADKKLVKENLSRLALFNFWALLASLFAITSDRMEIFFLKYYFTPELVAVYGTTLQLFSGFLILFSTLNSLIFPKLSLLAGTEEFNKFLIRSFLGCLLVATILLPGIFLAEPVLTFLFNNKYSDSIPVFKILYPNYLLQLVFAPLGIALFALGKPKILAALAFIRLVFGLILDNLLIPELGVQGAATAYFLGQIISWLVLTGYIWAIVLR
ncbi:MAG: oligosaccharide flippase family protein [Leptospiraceae bacterium]|nr:oligosaccharide flippase family protein [Leptospiraceae bacterium]